MGRTRTARARLLRAVTALFAATVVASSARVEAFTLSTGVGAGGMTVGTLPYFAVSPHVTVAWPLGAGFLLGAHGMVSILPNDNRGPGVYAPISALVGYDWERRTFGFGPSVALFYMPACGIKYCAPTGGIAPGIHARVEQYLAGPFGVAVSGDVNWVIGNNSVLTGDVAAMVIGSLVIRWEGKGLR